MTIQIVIIVSEWISRRLVNAIISADNISDIYTDDFSRSYGR